LSLAGNSICSATVYKPNHVEPVEGANVRQARIDGVGKGHVLRDAVLPELGIPV